jgi:hypothetical protein
MHKLGQKEEEKKERIKHRSEESLPFDERAQLFDSSLGHIIPTLRRNRWRVTLIRNNMPNMLKHGSLRVAVSKLCLLISDLTEMLQLGNDEMETVKLVEIDERLFLDCVCVFVIVEKRVKRLMGFHEFLHV